MRCRAPGSAARGCVRALAALALILATALARPASAADMADPPPQVLTLLELLADPTVRDWLAERQAGRAEAPPVAAEAQGRQLLAHRVAAVRANLAALLHGVPAVPADVARAAAALRRDLGQGGPLAALLPILGFAVLGLGAEWLYRRATAGARQRRGGPPPDSLGRRLGAAAVGAALELGAVAAFAAGSLGAFLVFDWPVLLREIVLGLLAAVVAVRLAAVAVRFLLAPPAAAAAGDAPCSHIVPVTGAMASFWSRRIVLAVAWLAFGWAVVDLLATLGVSAQTRGLFEGVLGLGLLALGLETVWSHWRRGAPAGAAGRRLAAMATSLLLVALWLLWVADARALFWLIVFATSLPAAIVLVQRAIRHVLRPPGEAGAAAGMPTVLAVGIERGVRALLIVLAVALLALEIARAWGIDLAALAYDDSPLSAVARGVLRAVVVLLVADVVWALAKTLIDRMLQDAAIAGVAGSDEARRRARLRTLLPILRMVMLVALVAVAGMMALSAVGVEIGPLIAGAGVVGIAIGFGAQTLVKDIFSGFFYLLDDAFRVGEYIQSGSYKGTVETFSLRSIKLRHHRGPLYTVPFGELGAIQNLSRDWVIDKLTVGVTYTTDLDKVKKLIKAVGKELAADPKFAPNILETLKMQGVEQFGDFAIQIRMKMMTKPGEQFVIRRRAYALIKKTFAENGVEFAFPTVQVAGGGDASMGAVARQAYEATRQVAVGQT